jgi:hypothetical protein
VFSGQVPKKRQGGPTNFIENFSVKVPKNAKFLPSSNPKKHKEVYLNKLSTK